MNQAKAQAAVSGNQARYSALVADCDGVITLIRDEPEPSGGCARNGGDCRGACAG